MFFQQLFENLKKLKESHQVITNSRLLVTWLLCRPCWKKWSFWCYAKKVDWPRLLEMLQLYFSNLWTRKWFIQINVVLVPLWYNLLLKITMFWFGFKNLFLKHVFATKPVVLNFFSFMAYLRCTKNLLPYRYFAKETNYKKNSTIYFL